MASAEGQCRGDARIALEVLRVPLEEGLVDVGWLARSGVASAVSDAEVPTSRLLQETVLGGRTTRAMRAPWVLMPRSGRLPLAGVVEKARSKRKRP